MTTVQQVVDGAFRKLGQRPTMNTLDGSLDASQTSVMLTHSQVPGPGNRLAVGVEDMHVWSVSGQTCTVARGFGGSTAATASDGALVYVNPEYSPFEVIQALNEVLTLLPGSGVVQFKTVDLTSSPVSVGYNLTSVTDLLRVHRVAYETIDSSDNWPVIPRRQWTVQQKSSTTDFASGEALFLYGPYEHPTTIRVLYQAPFSTVSTLAHDLETDAGVPGYAHPLVTVGVAYRLLLGRAPARASMQAQGDTRRPEEVSATDSRTTLAALYQEWLTLMAGVKRDQSRRYGAGA